MGTQEIHDTFRIPQQLTKPQPQCLPVKRTPARRQLRGHKAKRQHQTLLDDVIGIELFHIETKKQIKAGRHIRPQNSNLFCGLPLGCLVRSLLIMHMDMLCDIRRRTVEILNSTSQTRCCLGIVTPSSTSSKPWSAFIKVFRDLKVSQVSLRLSLVISGSSNKSPEIGSLIPSLLIHFLTVNSWRYVWGGNYPGALQTVCSLLLLYIGAKLHFCSKLRRLVAQYLLLKCHL